MAAIKRVTGDRHGDYFWPPIYSRSVNLTMLAGRLRDGEISERRDLAPRSSRAPAIPDKQTIPDRSKSRTMTARFCAIAFAPALRIFRHLDPLG